MNLDSSEDKKIKYRVFGNYNMSPEAKELFSYMIIITIVCAIEVKVILIFIEFTFNFKIDEMMKTRNILMAQISQYQDINKNMKCYLFSFPHVH